MDRPITPFVGAKRGSFGTSRIARSLLVSVLKGHWWGKGEFLRKKTWESRIYFLPGDSPVDHPDPANLIVVSDKVREHTHLFETLGSLNDRHYGVMKLKVKILVSESIKPMEGKKHLRGRKNMDDTHFSDRLYQKLQGLGTEIGSNLCCRPKSIPRVNISLVKEGNLNP
ncbi:hypothetical protein Bca52824_028309 [Brassica carinata]|uniref:Uncharacterized protein n=1 Tax=Brassica carinata TaxID=52824 RepID=A0A8X7VC80_BRACI|nr:hypothetical protein Bca52824_028309 [Brassica carinata]